MPIKFDLEKLRKQYECSNYFETGLYYPGPDSSSTMALKSNFEKVYCIEIMKEIVKLGNYYYCIEIYQGKYKLYCDDSANMKKYIELNKEQLKKRTIFFLDAHIDDENVNYKYKCPLFQELEAIRSSVRNDHIILIDDVRIIKRDYPWGEDKHGQINWLEELKQKILEINPNYKFKYLDGVIKDDVLCAYI